MLKIVEKIFGSAQKKEVEKLQKTAAEVNALEEEISKLQKENRELKENLGTLKQDHKKIRQALEFIMPAIMGKMENPEFKSNLFEGMKEDLMMEYNGEKSVSDESEFSLTF